MFLSINRNTQLTERYIQSVTYSLDKSFTNDLIKVKSPPYLLTRIVNSPSHYEVKCEITFKPWTKVKPIQVVHVIGFNDKMTIQTFNIETGLNLWDLDKPAKRNEAEFNTLK